MDIKRVILKYNIEDELPLSYGHKLRGYFANRFKNKLFHHHHKDGSLRYKYPLIQYKIIDGQPVIVGLEDGAELIVENFLDIEKLTIGKKEYLNPGGQLKVDDVKLEVVTKYSMPVFKYNFISPWLGLSQKNYKKYIDKIKGIKDEEIKFFSSILTGNILSFAKGINWWVEKEINVVPKLEEVPVKFKGKDMIGFIGKVYSNIRIPEKIGLGKSTSRGFGTIRREKVI